MVNPSVDLRTKDAVRRGRTVTITVDGEPLAAHLGESIAAALLASGRRHLRNSPTGGTPRGMFCAMGVCQECVVYVDGRAVTGCQTPVRDGLAVTLLKEPL